MRVLSITFFSLFVFMFYTHSVADNLEWDAHWIDAEDTGDQEGELYLFRKIFFLDSVPDKFEINVSADNRYKLFVNERLVSLGPVIGDIKHWNFQTVDLVPFLKKGNNIVAAQVWNEGNLKPVFQFSIQSAFLLQGTDYLTKKLNTNASWKCIKDISYTPIKQKVRGYYAAGAGERIDMNQKLSGWAKLDFDDRLWRKSHEFQLERTTGYGIDKRKDWILVPSILPPMEMKMLRLVSTRRTEGIYVPEGFPEKKKAVDIPANSVTRILLDQSELTNAYPTLIFSGGKNSTVILTYAEALYDHNWTKGNRDEIEGKFIFGRQDTIISNGMKNQNFTALNWRTYRYLEIKVKTKEEPLTIDDVYGTFTGYPFELKAKLESGIDELNKIMEIGWRTARLCAVETYMDCPYYERLQYIGDARIQMMISYYNSGDDRLAKYALNLWDYSRQPDGYTLSRYPDTIGQVILPYSLWYVSALNDYMFYGKDRDFVREKLLGTRQILGYFISHIAEDGSLKKLPGWNFTDWVPDWQKGIAPMDNNENSSVLDLQLLLALQAGILLEEREGIHEYAALYRNTAEKLAATIKVKYWDGARKLFADTPKKDKFSQHANSMAILAGLVEGHLARKIGEQLLSDKSFATASIYFKYYLHLALNKAGFGDQYLSWLDIWQKNISLGLTTWGETSDVETTRSDCHAWGSSPNIEFFRILLGIESAAPYFDRVRIEPHIGDVKKIGGEIPHPNGKIIVNYDNSGKYLAAQIKLPAAITGIFIWKGKSYELTSGTNTIKIESL